MTKCVSCGYREFELIIIVEPLMYTFFQAPGDLLALSIPFSPHSPNPQPSIVYISDPKKLH